MNGENNLPRYQYNYSTISTKYESLKTKYKKANDEIRFYKYWVDNYKQMILELQEEIKQHKNTITKKNKKLKEQDLLMGLLYDRIKELEKN